MCGEYRRNTGVVGVTSYCLLCICDTRQRRRLTADVLRLARVDSIVDVCGDVGNNNATQDSQSVLHGAAAVD